MAWEGDRIDKFKEMLAQFDETEINLQNDRGQTALYCASHGGHKEHVLALLLHPGIDCNCQTKLHGSTPLHIAGFKDHPKIVALLLAAGADTKIQNYGKSANIPGLTPREEAFAASLAVYTTWETEGPEALQRIEPDVALILRERKQQFDPSKLTNYTCLPEIPPESIMWPLPVEKKQTSEEHREVLSKTQSTKTSGNKPAKAGSVSKTGTLGSSHLPKIKVLEGKSWTEATVALHLEGNIYRVSWFHSDPKKTRTFGKLMATAVLQPSPRKNMCGLIRDAPPGTVGVSQRFYVIDYLGVKTQFSCTSDEEREAWLSKIYHVLHPLETKEKKKNEKSADCIHIEKWQRWADDGLFQVVPEAAFHHTKSAVKIAGASNQKNELEQLTAGIEKITSEDVYWAAHQVIKATIEAMPGSDPIRQDLNSILETPRPHDLIDTESGNDPLESLRNFGAFLSDIVKRPSDVVSMHLKTTLVKLQKIYRNLEASDGALPRVDFMRSGERKIGSRVVPPVTAALIAGNDRNYSGVHRVVRIGNVFFKINPAAPAYEMAVGQVNQVIWHQGTALALVVKFEIGGNQYVCQAANAIEGVLFGEFMKRARHLVKYVDHDSLTLQYIAGSIYRPNDGKCDNIMVTVESTPSGKKKMKLVCIDNDESFCDDFLWMKGNVHYLGIKYAIWLLPRPRCPADYTDESRKKSFIMSRPACEALLVHSPEYIVIQLMAFLHHQAQRNYDLYHEGVITKEQLLGNGTDEHGLIARWRAGSADRMVKEIKKAQALVKNVDVTFEEFLNQMYPPIGKMYTWANLRIQADLENFEDAFIKHIFTERGDPGIERCKEFMEDFPTFGQEIQEFTTNVAFWRQNRTFTCASQIETVIEKTDFSEQSIHDHMALLSVIENIPLDNITILNSHFFSKKHLFNLFHQKNIILKTLTINNCSEITQQDIIWMSKHCKLASYDQPIKLIIKNCDQLPPEITQYSHKNQFIIEVESSRNIVVLLKELMAWVNSLDCKLPSSLKNTLLKLDPTKCTTKIFDEIADLFPGLVSELDQGNINSLKQAFAKYNTAVSSIGFGSVKFLAFLISFLGEGETAGYFKSEETQELLFRVAAKYNQEAGMMALLQNREAWFNHPELTFDMLTQVARCDMVKATTFILANNPSLLKQTSLQGDTPLFLVQRMSSKVDKIPILKLILEQEPDLLKIPNFEGMNPLHVAAKFGNSANVIDFLIDSGVEINSKDRIEQVTPITMMVRRYYEHTKRDKPDQDELFHVVKKMLSAGGKLSLETFLLPLQQKDLELVKFLFATSGIQTLHQDLQNADGQTLLHVVEDIDILKLLVQNCQGKGVDHEDVDGITPLMYLFARCQNENRESFNKILEQANFLIKSGADLNHLNKSGWNILHMALITKQGGKQRLPNLVASLIELGIDLKVLTQDKDSFTVLHLALKTGITQVIRQLVVAMKKMDRSLLDAIMSHTPTTPGEISLKEHHKQEGEKSLLAGLLPKAAPAPAFRLF